MTPITPQSIGIPAPWNARAEELLEKQGWYSDYTAWEEWMNEKMNQPCMFLRVVGKACSNCLQCNTAIGWEDADTMFRISLYGAMVDALVFRDREVDR